MEGILVFAADHRTNVEWNLPYIRLGNFQSDAALNIKYDKEIAPFQQLLSEGAQLWWLSKHIKELGDPDYISLMHYGRFFTSLKTQKSAIINCPIEMFKPEYALTPTTIKIMMMSKKLDVLTIIPNIPTQAGAAAENAKEQLKLDIKNWNVEIADEMIDDAFELFFNNCKNEELRNGMQKAMVRKAHFNCNLMCLKSQWLKEYMDILVPTFKELKTKYDDRLFQMSPRAFSYILERFTSLYLFGARELGRNVAAFPVIVVKKQAEFNNYKF